MAHVPSAVRPEPSGQAAAPILPLILPSKTIFPSKMLHCDVVFGSPSMNCNGTGICKINITNFGQGAPAKKSCQLTLGIASAAPNGAISLYFFREFLCVRLYRQHFRKGILSMTEACPIPPELGKGLNIKSKTMLPGNYAVEELEGYFRVDLDCG